MKAKEGVKTNCPARRTKQISNSLRKVDIQLRGDLLHSAETMT